MNIEDNLYKKIIIDPNIKILKLIKLLKPKSTNIFAYNFVPLHGCQMLRMFFCLFKFYLLSFNFVTLVY